MLMMRYHNIRKVNFVYSIMITIPQIFTFNELESQSKCELANIIIMQIPYIYDYIFITESYANYMKCEYNVCCELHFKTTGE